MTDGAGGRTQPAMAAAGEETFSKNTKTGCLTVSEDTGQVQSVLRLLFSLKKQHIARGKVLQYVSELSHKFTLKI